MDLENKLNVAHRTALISGVFCAVVALLLLLNFWHMSKNEPFESATIEALVKRLSDEPNNEELKKEIRNFDLLARRSKLRISSGQKSLFHEPVASEIGDLPVADRGNCAGSLPEGVH